MLSISNVFAPLGPLAPAAWFVVAIAALAIVLIVPLFRKLFGLSMLALLCVMLIWASLHHSWPTAWTPVAFFVGLFACLLFFGSKKTVKIIGSVQNQLKSESASSLVEPSKKALPTPEPTPVYTARRAGDRIEIFDAIRGPSGGIHYCPIPGFGTEVVNYQVNGGILTINVKDKFGSNLTSVYDIKKGQVVKKY